MTRMIFGLPLFVLLICLFVVLPATAGKIYKWVDSAGNVSYSQMPPPQDQDVRQEKVRVDGASSIARVTRHGNYEYCGDLKLPGPVSEPERLYRQLHGKSNYWQSKLKNTQKSLQRSINSKYKSDIKYRNTWLKGIGEYKCAINWELRKREELKDVEVDIDQKFRQAQLNLDSLSKKTYDDCGPEPVLGGDALVFEANKREWRSCMKKHRKVINRAKSTLRSAESDFELLR